MALKRTVCAALIAFGMALASGCLSGCGSEDCDEVQNPDGSVEYYYCPDDEGY